MAYSSRHSLCLAGRIAHHGNEQVGDAGPAHLAQRRELLTIDTVEKQDAAAEDLALVNRSKRPGGRDVLGTHHRLQVTRLEFLHGASEHDATADDENDVGLEVMYLLYLMGRNDDRASAIELVIQ